MTETPPHDWRVDLPVFSGPLDLLLYLVKKLEVEVEDIPIGRITDQYLVYLQTMQALDVDLAGEFLVMASTLIEIKSRALLPREELVAEDDLDDPRENLIKELLEYKQLKEASYELEHRAGWDEVRFGRAPEKVRVEGDPFQEVNVWDVATAWARLLAATGGNIVPRLRLPDKPLEFYQEEIRQALRQARSIPLVTLFGNSRDRLLGTFLALLEMIRLGEVRAVQDAPFAEIHVMAAEPPQQA